ncbi:MAG TPA: ABC transporter permease [Chthoniobacterales bacterium]
MKLPFTFFLALRYLRPKRTFLSIITLICILGVMLGVMVPIVVLSVMTGFDRELREKVVGFDAHLTIGNYNGPIDNWRKIVTDVTAIQGVTAVAPFVQGRVLVEYNNRRLAPYIRGIDPVSEEKVSSIKKYIPAGSGTFDLTGNNAIIGADLANELQIGVGDTLSIYSPSNIGQILESIESAGAEGSNKEALDKVRELVLPIDVTIAGIFKSGRYSYDSDYLLVPLNVAQELYTLEDAIHGISVKTVSADQAPQFQTAINRVLPIEPPIQASTWIEQNSQLFDAITVERNVMFFLLLFIAIVAGFGIINTLITTTVQKTREIGILKALGARVNQILWVFLAQGVVIGFFGTLSGLGLAILIVEQRNSFRLWLSETVGMQIFPAAVYQFAEIPAVIDPVYVTIICVSGFLICTVAALIPAYIAARLDPVKALRFE